MKVRGLLLHEVVSYSASSERCVKRRQQ